MKVSAQVLAVGLGLLDVASAACPSLQMFVARGTLEQQSSNGGQGVLGSVVTPQILAEIPGSVATGVTYEATFDYAPSETTGIGNLTNMIESFVAKCPNSKIALIGYSQGAQVVSDTVCGRDETGFTFTDPIPVQYTKNVVAIVALADPANTPGLVGVTRFGNGTLGGGFPRSNLNACAHYAGRFGSWCTSNDDVCDHGDSLIVHIQEPAVWQQQMISFVVELYYYAIGEKDPYPVTLTSASYPTKSVVYSTSMTTTVKPTTTTVKPTTTTVKPTTTTVKPTTTTAKLTTTTVKPTTTTFSHTTTSFVHTTTTAPFSNSTTKLSHRAARAPRQPHPVRLYERDER